MPHPMQLRLLLRSDGRSLLGQGGLGLLFLLGCLISVARSDDEETASSPRKETSASSRTKLSEEERQSIVRQAGELDDQVCSFLAEHKLAEGLAVQRKLVMLVKERLGEVEILTMEHNLFLDELEKASKLAIKQRKVFLTARSRFFDALPSVNNCDYDRAEPLLREALDGLINSVGEQSITTWGVRENLGIICLGDDEPRKAKELFLENLRACKLLAGDQHAFYARCLLLTGWACVKAKEFDQAEAPLQNSLSIFRRLAGVNSLHYHAAQEPYCRLLIQRGRLPEAEAMCRSAIAAFNDNPRSTIAASYSFYLANVDIAYGDLETAEGHIRRSLSVYEPDLPRRSGTVAEMRERLVWLLKEQGRFDEAEEVAARPGIRKPQR